MTRAPNIVFFFTDDQRFDTIHALGNPDIRTPNLDRLVDAGTAFTHATIMGGSCPAVCMPSRAMLMTGRSLFRIDGLGQRIPPEHKMIGETLQEAGYRTFGTGKWHNGTESFARSFSAGAEIFFGGMDDHWNVPVCDFDPTGKYEALIHQTVDFRSQVVARKHCTHIHAGKHSSDLFADAAVDFIREYDDTRPFFVYIAFMAPHDPRTMPEHFRTLFDPSLLNLPENVLPRHPFDNGELEIRDEQLEAWPRTPEAIRRHLADYYAMIAHADDNIGKVLRAIDESGWSDDTLIVFAGDNGLALGQHGLMGKQSVYEHSIRVPLILQGPDVPRGETRDDLCTLCDVAPTLCEFATCSIPDSSDGHSLLPAISGGSRDRRKALPLAYRDVQRGIREERYKLIEYAVNGCRTTQLFDLDRDPLETENLADKPGAEAHVKRLRALLLEHRLRTGDTREHERTFWDTFERT